MPTITLKGIPPDLYERLKTSAVRHRRSINRETIYILEQGLSPRRRDPKVVLARIDALRERLNLTPLTDDELNEAKRGGRP
jgi:plasmid stability protein